MIALLIDPAGQTWNARSDRLRAIHGVGVADHALPGFLVRNLGFVGVEFTDDTCTVKAAPARVMYATFITLAGLITRRRPGRVALAWFDGRWNDEIYPGNTNAAAERLFELMCRDRSAAGERYLTEPRALTALTAGNALTALFAAWREKAGGLSQQNCPQLFNGILQAKFVVLDATEAGDLVFSEVGEGLMMYQAGWAGRAIGRPVDEQPDVGYGSAVADSWRSAFLSDEPLLYDVDAIVSDPRGRRNWRTQYSRLTLPIRDGGRRRLLSASLPNRAVDLRVKVQ